MAKIMEDPCPLCGSRWDGIGEMCAECAKDNPGPFAKTDEEAQREELRDESRR